jgi:hypothetical protein
LPGEECNVLVAYYDGTKVCLVQCSTGDVACGLVTDETEAKPIVERFGPEMCLRYS